MFYAQKRPRQTSHGRSNDFLDELPDDIVIFVLGKLCSSASCPSDFINVLLTCKRLNRLALHPLVLCKASQKTLSVRARNWSEYAHRFLKQCANAGNVEASYMLGMIRFYCLQLRRSGAALMAKAAAKSHDQALYSLAVIQFNGSGGSKNGRDLRAGVALCARAAVLGHIDAIRELGHCLQDGYGVRQNMAEGRRFLLQANLREFASNKQHLLEGHSNNGSGTVPQPEPEFESKLSALLEGGFWSDFGCNVAEQQIHPANQFLVEWFVLRTEIPIPGKALRMCSHVRCGRPETRKNEFRRCSSCGKVNYCSRGCQAHDWKMRHKVECAPMVQWIDMDQNAVVEEDDIDENDAEDPTVEMEPGVNVGPLDS